MLYSRRRKWKVKEERGEEMGRLLQLRYLARRARLQALQRRDANASLESTPTQLLSAISNVYTCKHRCREALSYY